MSLVHEGMALVMAAVSHVAKKRSQGVSYEFRSVDDVMNHLHGPLAEHGLFLSPRVLPDWQLNLIPGAPDQQGNPRSQVQAVFRVCVDVYAADGSMVTLGPGLAQSHDYGDKAVYQAQQNAVKYLLLEAFAIPTAEQDMDGRQPDDVAANAALGMSDDERNRLGTNRLKALAVDLVGPERAAGFYAGIVEGLGLDPNYLAWQRHDQVTDALTAGAADEPS